MIPLRSFGTRESDLDGPSGNTSYSHITHVLQGIGAVLAKRPTPPLILHSDITLRIVILQYDKL